MRFQIKIHTLGESRNSWCKGSWDPWKDLPYGFIFKHESDFKLESCWGVHCVRKVFPVGGSLGLLLLYVCNSTSFLNFTTWQCIFEYENICEI